VPDGGRSECVLRIVCSILDGGDPVDGSQKSSVSSSLAARADLGRMAKRRYPFMRRLREKVSQYLQRLQWRALKRVETEEGNPRPRVRPQHR
jgi:hypothetical protein